MRNVLFYATVSTYYYSSFGYTPLLAKGHPFSLYCQDYSCRILLNNVFGSSVFILAQALEVCKFCADRLTVNRPPIPAGIGGATPSSALHLNRGAYGTLAITAKTKPPAGGKDCDDAAAHPLVV